MNALQKKQRRSSIFRQSPTNNSRECDNHHHGFLFHWAFSARLPGDVESRPRGTPSRSRRHTFGHEYPRVRRTHLGNSIATTTGSSIRYSVATLATTHSKPSPMCKRYPSVPVLWSPRQSQRRGYIPPRSLEARARTHPSRMRCSKTKIHATIPYAACDRGLCARGTDCRAVVGVQSVRRVFDAKRGHLWVWVSCSRSLNCNYSMQ